MQKKAYNFYRSYYDILNMLNDKQYVQFSRAIHSVMFFDAHIDSITFDDKTLAMLWVSVKHSLRQSVDGFLSKNNLQYIQAINPPTEGACQGATQDPCLQGEGQGEEQGKGKGEGQYATCLPDYITKQTWSDVKKHRTKIKKPMTERAEKILLGKLATIHSAGIDIDAAVDMMVDKSWSSISVEWYQNEMAKRGTSSKPDEIQRSGFTNNVYSEKF